MIKTTRYTFGFLLLLFCFTFSFDIAAQTPLCYRANDKIRPIAVNFKGVPVRSRNTVNRFRFDQPAPATALGCINQLSNMKISVRNNLKYRNANYPGNVYDGKHLLITFRDIRTNRVLKTVPVIDGGEISWQPRTKAEITFMFPSPGAPGVDYRRNRINGSIMVAIYRSK